jgi:putative hydrolase of the HAD superfamily
MIKNLLFDFGDVFINLHKGATREGLLRAGYNEIPPSLLAVSEAYEIGEISTDTFLEQVNGQLPRLSRQEIMVIWNAMILDFPEYRLDFIKALAKENNYRLFLLSNTNELHIQRVIEAMGEARFQSFKECFEKFYLSHEIGLRKPTPEVFHMILKKNSLDAEATLFIDDTLEHIQTAKSLGLKTWHLQPGLDDIVELNTKI